MAETIRDIVLKLKLQTEKPEVKRPDMSAAEQALGKYEENVQKAMDKTADSAVQSEKKFRENAEKVAAAAERLDTIQEKQVETNLKLGDSLRTAGEGTFQLARGFAFLGASGEEDLQKALQTIAKFQAGWDIFKGGIEITRGVVEGWKTLRLQAQLAAEAEALLATTTAATSTASKAAAASNVAQSASQVAVGSTAGTAAVGITALRTALGDPTVIITIVAALAGAAAIFGTMGKEAEKAKIPIDDLLSGFDKVAREAEEYRSAETAFTKDIAGLMEAADATRHYEERLSDLAAAKAQSLAPIEGVQAQREGSKGAMMQRFGQLNLEKAIVAESRDIYQDLGSLEERRLDAEIKSVEVSVRKLDVLKQQLAAEDERSAALDRQLGALSKVEQIELERLTKKAQQGSLSREEAISIGQLGGEAGRVVGGKRLEELGKGFSGRDALRDLAGLDDKKTEVESTIAALTEALGLEGGDAAQELQDRLGDLRDARDQNATATMGAMRDLAERERELTKEIEELRATFEQRLAREAS